MKAKRAVRKRTPEESLSTAELLMYVVIKAIDQADNVTPQDRKMFIDAHERLKTLLHEKGIDHFVP